MNARMTQLVRPTLLAFLLALHACSKPPEEASGDSSTAPPAPAVDQAGASAEADELTSTLNAGAFPTTYRATFSSGAPQRIVETRQRTGAEKEQGEYEFYGARLLRYKGAGLTQPEAIELEFDLQGVLTRSESPSGTVPETEVAAVRTRAQLLRSHALAQHAVQGHERSGH
ncbi:MAG TPA: hypothetical protein VF193_17415 [Steroidobacter sp.]